MPKRPKVANDSIPDSGPASYAAKLRPMKYAALPAKRKPHGKTCGHGTAQKCNCKFTVAASRPKH